MRPSEDRASEAKHAIAQHWGERAATFDQRPSHGLLNDEQRMAWRSLLEQLAGSRPLAVLDMGCGTGFLALLLAELGHTVTGVDLSPEMLAIARRKAADAGLAVEFRQADAEALDQADGTFDLVVARHLIWTLPNPARAAQEWRRLLRPSGRLALIEGQWDEAGGWQERDDEYKEIGSQLPFYGGVSAERCSAFLAADGFIDIAVEPLMDARFWIEAPDQERYLIVGRRG